MQFVVKCPRRVRSSYRSPVLRRKYVDVVLILSVLSYATTTSTVGSVIRVEIMPLCSSGQQCDYSVGYTSRRQRRICSRPPSGTGHK